MSAPATMVGGQYERDWLWPRAMSKEEAGARLMEFSSSKDGTFFLRPRGEPLP